MTFWEMNSSLSELLSEFLTQVINQILFLYSFTVVLNMRAARCPVCLDSILFGRQISKCTGKDWRKRGRCWHLKLLNDFCSFARMWYCVSLQVLDVVAKNLWIAYSICGTLQRGIARIDDRNFLTVWKWRSWWWQGNLYGRQCKGPQVQLK